MELFSKLGLPKPLAWGYLGIIIFMMGDGVEQGWLSPYLIEHGLSMQQSALLFTVYGITIAIASWFSGVLAEGYGPRKAMLLGLLLYIIGTVGFVGLGLGLRWVIPACLRALPGSGMPTLSQNGYPPRKRGPLPMLVRTASLRPLPFV